MTESPEPTAARAVVPGSERPSLPGTDLGPVDAATVVEVSIVLRRRAEPSAADFAGAPLTQDELAARFGADPTDVATVTRALESAGAEVVAMDPASRVARIRGPVGVLSALFGTSLTSVQLEAGPTVRARSGPLSLPAALAGPVVAVLGLDDRPQARERLRVAAAATTRGLTPVQIAAAYQFPGGDGTGQRLAIVELGGGFSAADLDTFFGGLSLATPTVTAVGVDGAANRPGQDPQGADGEVLLDIEVAGAIAPAAAQLVYFAPNTDAGFLDAVTRAAHASPAPTAMSISWGQSEDQWTAQARTAMDQAFADAALLGVTVTAAAGDNGSGDNGSGDNGGGSGAHVDFPASSPHVLACGGTTLTLAADGSIASETVWNDGATGGATGGGVSDAFAIPSWQADAGVPTLSGGGTGRGVPDVAGDADPATGYRVVVDGRESVIGGTSAVAPLWAGLACRLAQVAGRPLGLLHPVLYRGAAAGAAAPGFRDVTTGDNGAYRAGPGWDACTGLGSPDGTALSGVVAGAG